MNVECTHCGGVFLAVFSIDTTTGLPRQLDTTTCPHCQEATRVEYSADNRPPAQDFTHSGEIVTARTPDAFEWWRHNKEFFTRLRYRPRRTRV